MVMCRKQSSATNFIAEVLQYLKCGIKIEFQATVPYFFMPRTAHAMDKPSWVDVPLPISSIITYTSNLTKKCWY